MTKISILGQDWTIQEVEPSSPSLNDNAGICYMYAREIYISNELDKDSREHTIKHEILHAYRHESGFNDHNDIGSLEVWIDWITLQHDKIHQTYIELGLYHDIVDVTTLGGE